MQAVHLIEGDTPKPHSKVEKKDLKLMANTNQARRVPHFSGKIRARYNANKTAPKKHFSVYFQIQFQ